MNETLLRDVLYAKGPIAAAMYGRLHSFQYYSSGVYDDPTCPEGFTHSMLIVGYGTENYPDGSSKVREATVGVLVTTCN